jgi:uncharacterized protein (DUF1330 family)
VPHPDVHGRAAPSARGPERRPPPCRNRCAHRLPLCLPAVARAMPVNPSHCSCSVMLRRRERPHTYRALDRFARPLVWRSVRLRTTPRNEGDAGGCLCHLSGRRRRRRPRRAVHEQGCAERCGGWRPIRGAGWRYRSARRRPASARTSILEFPTREAAHAWYFSDDYTEIRQLREGASRSRMYIVDGDD